MLNYGTKIWTKISQDKNQEPNGQKKPRELLTRTKKNLSEIFFCPDNFFARMVNCQQPLPRILHLLNPPLYTAGLFAKTKKKSAGNFIWFLSHKMWITVRVSIFNLFQNRTLKIHNMLKYLYMAIPSYRLKISEKRTLEMNAWTRTRWYMSFDIIKDKLFLSCLYKCR